MNQHIDRISSNEAFKGMLKRCSLITFTFFCLSGGKAYGDSTYFPEDTSATDKGETSAEHSEAIKEWAEIAVPKKQTAEVLSVSNVPTTTVTTGSKEHRPLRSTTVEPRSKVLPVKDQATGQEVAKKTVLSYADAANDRAPLGIIERTQEVHHQKWYIYSSAIRGLKNPSDKLQIVSMEDAPPNKGEEIKDLLVEMGIEPEKIQLIHGTGEENQKGTIYIFAGK